MKLSDYICVFIAMMLLALGIGLHAIAIDNLESRIKALESYEIYFENEKFTI